MNDLLVSIAKIINRDLETLEKEIEAYPQENAIWLLQGEIKNTAGNLCLHLCGNLQHFIGAILGNTGYVRDREKEFSQKNISRRDLVNEIRKTRLSVDETLLKLDPRQLSLDYPIQVFGEPMTTHYFLVHLTGHLGYHLGQINYHRRILSVAKI